MTRMNWDHQRRQSKVRPDGPSSTPDKRGREKQASRQPLGKKRARQLGVCRKCRQRFGPGEFAEPTTGTFRGPQVYQHRGTCPKRAPSGVKPRRVIAQQERDETSRR